VERVCVIGNSGSGKTTLARALAARLDLERLELDALYHQANWTPLPDDEFRTRVTAFCAAPRWVTDGNYKAVAPIIWSYADTILWLDYPRWRTTWRVLRRSVRRATLRRELWNGNVESWRNLLSRDRKRNVVLWSFTAHAAKREQYGRAAADGTWANTTVHRFRRPRDTDRWLAQLTEEHHGR
jgi:adenylate kinase family enzyme